MTIKTSDRPGFSRDDSRHRLGAIAANLDRINTFAGQAYDPKIVRGVIDETRYFVEWTAGNVVPEDAEQLVALQRLVVKWLRDWEAIQYDHTRRSEIAPIAASWSERLLAMSGLADEAGHVKTQPLVIPPGHKFAIIALGGNVWHRIETVCTNVGSFTRVPPVSLDDFWKTKLGELRHDRFMDPDLCLVVTRPSKSPGVLNREDAEVARECRLLRVGLAITTQYFKNADGIGGVAVSGAHERHGCTVRSCGTVGPLPPFPETKSVQLTEPDMLRAGVFAEALNALDTSSRLARAVGCFMSGMEAWSAAQRVHQFVRCVDGIIQPRKSNSRKDFVSAVGSVLAGGQESVLEEIYEIRSAEEHLRDPREEVDGPTIAERQATLSTRAFQAEVIARHLLSRVLEVPELRRVHAVESDAEKYWRGSNRNVWEMPLDLGAIAVR